MNNFRDKTMRQQYEVAVICFNMKHRDLFIGGASNKAPATSANPVRRSSPNLGSNFASSFWAGYDGQNKRAWADKASRSMVCYAYYRAGQDCARPTGEQR